MKTFSSISHFPYRYLFFSRHHLTENHGFAGAKTYTLHCHKKIAIYFDHIFTIAAILDQILVQTNQLT